jgi:hypothetical protein
MVGSRRYRHHTAATVDPRAGPVVNKRTLAKRAKSVSAVTLAAIAAAGRFGGRSRAEHSRSQTPQSYARPTNENP